MGVGGQHHAPPALPPGKTRCPLYRRLGRLQGRSGRVRKISPPPGFYPRDRPARSESLYRLSYPGPSTSVPQIPRCHVSEDHKLSIHRSGDLIRIILEEYIIQNVSTTKDLPRALQHSLRVSISVIFYLPVRKLKLIQIK